jgi:hypothetical protein
MDKGFKLAAAMILAMCVSVAAQEGPMLKPLNVLNADVAMPSNLRGSSPDLFGTLEKTYALPTPVSLIDSDPFTFMDAFAWTALTPTYVLSPLSIPNQALLAAHPFGTLMEKQPITLERNSNYVWGEVGGRYGTTVGGKSSLEVKEGYIVGGFGDERTQVTVGASYSNWKGSLPGNFH